MTERRRSWLLAGIALVAVLAGVVVALLSAPLSCRATPPAPYVAQAYDASRATECGSAAR